MTDCELVIAQYVSDFYIYILCTQGSGRLGHNFRLVEPGFRMEWTVSKTFGCESVDEVSNGFEIKSVAQFFNGCTSAMVTKHS
jgi:hypothetical protein